ncbi:MAG TPA: hypothetical protein PLF75_10185, partial [Bacteroidales bacterium]|nr:hypothetical protein [Bacteroidales bacterium]
MKQVFVKSGRTLDAWNSIDDIPIGIDSNLNNYFAGRLEISSRLNKRNRRTPLEAKRNTIADAGTYASTLASTLSFPY